MRYSPDVESALRSVVRYMHLHIGGAVTTLEVSGKTAMLSYEIYQADAEATSRSAMGGSHDVQHHARTVRLQMEPPRGPARASAAR